MAETEKPRSESTGTTIPSRLQSKLPETNFTKLEKRRQRSPNGTPIAHTEHKENLETTDDKLERKSRSLTDPDISGRLRIEGADGLFSQMNAASTFKESNLSSFKSIDTTMEKPLFISSQSDGSKQSVTSLKANFEQGTGIIDGANSLHMVEFANPLHKGNKQRLQKSKHGGSLKAVKPPVAPKPPSPAKNLSSPQKKTVAPVGPKPTIAIKPELSPFKKPVVIDHENMNKGETSLYEEIPSLQPESQEHYSSDEDDGLYSKVVHNGKPMPMHPPPRRCANPNVDNVCKEADENSVAEQENKNESERLSELPIYAKVNKQKSKTLENIVGNNSQAVIGKTRSDSDPTPKNTKLQDEVSAIREEAPAMDGSDSMKDNNSDIDDDDEPPWDPDDFDDDSDFDVNTGNPDSRSLSEDGQEDNMEFPDEKSKKLYNIAKEILTTEKAYVRRLHLLDQVFNFRLQNECLAHGHIPPEVMQDVFSNISAIHKLHKDFLLPLLEARMSEWSTNNVIGDILKKLAPFLKLYTAYIANFDKSSETLATWTKKSPKFAAIIEDIQKSSECENLTLGHHMLEPIQRVPRYKLLLRDYLAKLPEDSPDYKDCQDAMEIISAAAAHANDSMKKMERFKKLLELQDRLLEDNDLITASRQFIKEGDLVKVAARTAAGHQERTLLLFNDLLLCCAKVPGTNKLKVKVQMDLDGMEIGDADEDVDLSNTFRITSKQKVIDFSANSDNDRDTWIKVLTETIEELIRKRQSYKRGIQTKPISECDLGKKAPVWVRDEAVTMCMLCDTMFTLTRRRHHCRACGGIFCNTCCHLKTALEYTGGKQNRVCQTCYKIIVRGDKRSVLKKKDEEKKTLDTRKIDSHTKVLLSGYLNYKGGSEKNWVKRWCVLSDNFVFYCYKAKKDTKAAFSIPLPGYVVDKPNLADDLDKKIAFKVHHKNMVIHFFAPDSEENLERWMHNLSFAVKAERIPEDKEQPASEERRSSMP